MAERFTKPWGGSGLDASFNVVNDYGNLLGARNLIAVGSLLQSVFKVEQIAPGFNTLPVASLERTPHAINQGMRDLVYRRKQ